VVTWKQGRSNERERLRAAAATRMNRPLGAAALKHVAIAQRIADAHRGIDDATFCSFVSGSTVDDLVDELSDVDMSVVFARLPGEAVLREACRRGAATGNQSSGGEWFWSMGNLDDPLEGGVVALHIDGVEVQIGYASDAALAADIDELVVRHNPDTPNHKLAEGIGKAMPLAGAEKLAALQRRVAAMPIELARAMVRHGLDAKPIHWRAARQLEHRDAPLWAREIQVEGCYALLMVLAGLDRVWFTRFQMKRMQRFGAKLTIAPARLAERIETLLDAPPREAFDALHAIEAEVLDLVARHMPEIDLKAARQRHASYGS
jgi:hypothetical protein